MTCTRQSYLQLGHDSPRYCALVESTIPADEKQVKAGVVAIQVPGVYVYKGGNLVLRKVVIIL